MASVIGQETTTLGEGATISVAVCQEARASGGLNTYTELRAWKGDDIVKMHVDPVSVHALRQYLALWLRAIERERARFTAKPEVPVNRPVNVTDFVRNMAFHGMFIFGVLDNGEQHGTNNTSRGKKMAAAGRKVSK
jgi:hypothetical protein